MTKVYGVQEDEHQYFTTKKDAVEAAKEWADHIGEAVDVTQYVVAKISIPLLYVRLLQGQQWVESSKIVYTAKPKARVK